MTNQQLMLQGKTWLKGGWNKAAGATLLMMAIISAPSFLGMAVFISLLMAGPMNYGYYLYLNRQIDYREQDFNLLFDGFTLPKLIQNVLAGLLVGLASIVGTALLIVPGIIVGLGFSMTFLIMIDHPEMTGFDAIKSSWRLMDGHKWSLFNLCLRFIGWYILNILTLGILTFWIQPYLACSIIGFYRQLRGHNATIY